MYFDDDLKDEKAALLSSTRKYKPFLRVYGKKEEGLRRVYADRVARVESPDPSTLTEAVNVLRKWRIRAFFKALQGFYKGKLDLTGRHNTVIDLYILSESIWHAYMTSFLKLTVLATSVTSEQISGSDDSSEEEAMDYKFDDPGVWEKFREAWKVPPNVSYGFLLEHTQKTLDVLAGSFGIPKIQEIHLLDLPGEILDEIFSHIEEHRARRLSSVCRRLNEIGYRRLVSSKKIVLKLAMSFYDELKASDLPVNQFIEKEAFAARDKVLAFCGHLERHSDLLNKLERLWIADQWADLWEKLQSTFGKGEFYAPLLRSVERIINSSVNLTTILFSQMRLPLNVIAAICRLPNLDHLDLRFCTISKKAQRALLLDVAGTLSSSVRILDIMVTHEKSPWFAMLFCPKLYNFSARAIAGSAFPPPESLWDKCRFFPTLKYLYLSDLVAFHIPTFAEWIQRASHGSMPELTHFKITVNMNMTDAAILGVLQAVHSAPLKVLSIGGALQAGLHLFDWIATHFPLLLGLTISRRDSTRQHRDNSADWPLPDWQYAERFSAFLQLQHFGWNNYNYNSSFSTYLLPLLEGGQDEDNYDGWEDMRENENFDPEVVGLWTPVLFGIHCPSLRTFQESMFATYRISRPSEGVVKAKNRSHREDTAKWDPSPSEPAMFAAPQPVDEILTVLTAQNPAE
ncbi:hypothetical protein DXG01_000992 [Tephrocybe rancida]|nr:hypothetical protein DXG01_000992 [Tephrocybe rancida]